MDRLEEPALSRPVAIEEIPEGGLAGHIAASAAERQNLAALYELLRLDLLEMDYRLTPRGNGRYRLEGRWRAHLAQACIVTLEPVEAEFDQPVTQDYWSEAALAEALRREAEPKGAERHVAKTETALDLGTEAPEPIEAGRIDPGRLLAELLAVHLNPYPRAPGISFEGYESGPAADEAAGHPFAALARLKRGKNESQ